MDAIRGPVLIGVAIITLIAVGIAALGIALSVSAPSTPGVPPLDWWNSTYHYRENLTIYNNDNFPYAPASVTTVINYQPNMQADFSDCNFLWIVGPFQVPIPATINSKSDGHWANVTMTVPAIAPHGTEHVWLYYG
jgi:hypothetical protein